MKKISFSISAYEEFNTWEKENKKIYEKIKELIRESCRTPFTGLGKPEPLKYKLKGAWSRRITQEHRLVYLVKDEELEIISCKAHYVF